MRHSVWVLFLMTTVPLWSQDAAPSAAPATPVVTLQECLDAATAGGPDVKIAQLTLASAADAYAQAAAKDGFSLGADADYLHQGSLPGIASSVRTDIGSGTTSTTLLGENVQGAVTAAGPSTKVSLSVAHALQESDNDANVTVIGVSGSQTLWDGYPGGRPSATLKQADATLQGAQVTYQQSRQSAAYAVKQAYYALLNAQDGVNTTTAALTQANEDLARTQAYLDAKQVTQLDVKQANVAVLQAQLNLRIARNALLTARKKLSALVGWPLDKDYRVAGTDVPDLPGFSVQDAIARAYANRGELASIVIAQASDRIGLALSRSQNSPTVALNANANIQQDWARSQTTGSFTAGLSVSVPILDAGLAAAETQASSHELAQLDAQLTQQRENIAVAVETDYLAVQTTHEQIAVSEQNESQLDGQYQLEIAEFQMGLATNLDVLTASANLIAAQVALAQAKNAYILAVLALQNDMGT